MSRSTSFTLGVAGAFAAVVLASDAGAAVSIREKPGHVTEGVITVNASPTQIYALVTDYMHWPSLLGDVESVTVEAGGRRDARVKFRSRSLQRNVTVLFDNDPARGVIRFRGVKGPPGGRASGEYVLVPIDGGKRTQVTARVYMDVVGLPGLFVSDKRVRTMRQAKVRTDLADLEHRFAPRS
jgi:hypothetical protein